MKKETTNKEEEYIERTNSLFDRIEVLNSNVLSKMNSVLGIFLLILSITLTLSTYKMKSEIEDHYVELDSFLSIENKDQFKKFEQDFLLGAKYSLSVKSMLLTLTKKDLINDEKASLISKFEDNINFWINTIIVSSISLSIIAFLLSSYFSKRAMTYQLSYYNINEEKYTQVKINKYDEYKTLSIPFLILLSIFSVMFKINTFDEETEKLFHYNLEVLDMMLNIFYVLGFIFFVWSLVNIFWKIETEKLDSSLLKEKSECVKDEEILCKIENEIIENKESLLKMNKLLTKKNITESELIAIRNIIDKSVGKKQSLENLNKEFENNEKIINQKDF